MHINCSRQKANRRFKFWDSFHCGIVESFEKSSRFKRRNMSRRSIIWNPIAPPMQAFKSCGSVSTPVITEALSRCYFRSLSDLALEPFFAKAHCAWVCLQRALLSPKLNIPLRWYKVSEGPAHPGHFHFDWQHPTPSSGPPSPLTTWKISGSIKIYWVLKRLFSSRRESSTTLRCAQLLRTVCAPGKRVPSFL